MTETTVVPFSLRDAPALIERLLPVQKLSVESYKEQMAVQGKTLTALGNYWKGRKPLILAKACVLGCLLPATDDLARDLAIFELLMGMDREALRLRLDAKNNKESRALFERTFAVAADAPYREWVEAACRAEECGDEVFEHIWDAVNVHLGTTATTFPELVEQLGIMRFGRRPRVADTFCGSGQIPFEAARLGADIFASDLSPVACMLTWGALNIVGGSVNSLRQLNHDQKVLVQRVLTEVDGLGVEIDGNGWRAKAFLYCVEVRCPQTGWLVPLLPTRIISKGFRAIAKLVPDPEQKRYTIVVSTASDAEEFAAARIGTVRTDGRGQDPYLSHTVDGVEYRTKISTLRGDYRQADGTIGNRLRPWEKSEFTPDPDDIFQERLYCIQWMRPKKKGKADEYEFRSVTEADLERERIVETYVGEHLGAWQNSGWVPDMRIEPGEKTDEPIRTRGWTYWHHLFNPRQLLVAGLTNQFSSAQLKIGLTQMLNANSRLSRWSIGDGDGRSGSVKQVFDNQALNTLFNYGTRGSRYACDLLQLRLKSFPLPEAVETDIQTKAAVELETTADIFITDPPYGDAVKYEEILEFFIAWLRKNPPPEFANWVWDSRRTLAIKGDDEAFRQGMVAAYRRMAEQMPDNGIQVIMFTHQSGAIWADMANIVWAAGLQVTAAWYVVTETDSALRGGSHVKGTVLLVVRKRQGSQRITSDDLAWAIQSEVQEQVETLTGLNQQAKGLYRDENLFEDADLQMAGYAAALRALTRYAIIDGRDMSVEALRPRVRGQATFVDELIDFAVGVANQFLVPTGIAASHWEKLAPAERFYLKLIDLEARGHKTLDNYQNFAKAFKVRDYRALLASQRANAARLQSAVEMGRTEMNEGSELYQTPLRALLYALMELVKRVDGDEVLRHLAVNATGYYDPAQRELLIELAGYLAGKLAEVRPEEASAARVLGELLRGQRL